MKLAYLSDTHTEMGAPASNLLDEPVDVVVLAGDIGKGVQAIQWAYETFSPDAKDIVVIFGNHDFWGGSTRHDKVLREARAWAAQYPNVHFLENNTVEIAGVFFIGATAWTDYTYGPDNPPVHMLQATDKENGIKDFKKIHWKTKTGQYRRIRPWDVLAMNSVSKNYIFSEIEKHGRENCVVVTHHAPTHLSIGPQYKDDKLNHSYVNTWGNEIAYNGPKLWVHGHVHSPSDYMVGDTRVVCNPIGYPHQRDGGGAMVIEL